MKILRPSARWVGFREQRLRVFQIRGVEVAAEPTLNESNPPSNETISARKLASFLGSKSCKIRLAAQVSTQWAVPYRRIPNARQQRGRTGGSSTVRPMEMGDYQGFNTQRRLALSALVGSLAFGGWNALLRSHFVGVDPALRSEIARQIGIYLIRSLIG